MFYSIEGRVSFNPKEKEDDSPDLHCEECFHLTEKDCKDFGCQCCCIGKKSVK